MATLLVIYGAVPMTLSPQSPGLLSHCLLVLKPGILLATAAFLNVSTTDLLGRIFPPHNRWESFPVHGRMFSKFFGFHPLDVSGITPLSIPCHTKNVSRHCQIVPRSQKSSHPPLLKITSLEACNFLVCFGS